MKPTIQGAGGPLREERLRELEQRLGHRLPDSYRSFLLQFNGGAPDLDHYPIRGMPNNPFGEIRMFLGLDAAADYRDLERTLEVLQDRLPAGLLPIGYSSGDDPICLSLRPTDFGAVYFVDSYADCDVTPWTDSGFSNAYFIANDFPSFLESLNTFESFAAESSE